MKREYEILWFEDDPEVVNEDIRPEIEKYLDTLGFSLNCTHLENGDNLDKMIENNNYDLILTDLNLGEEHETGEKIVRHIRDGKILTDVLLYSSDEVEMSKIIKKTGHLIERASFNVGMGNLSEKIKGIIDLTIKKVQDINNMRGLVIAETIDLEYEMEKILQDYFKVLDQKGFKEKTKKLFKKIFKSKVEQQKNWLDEINKFTSADITELINKDILTVNDIYNAIRGILKEKSKDINNQLNSSPLAKKKKEKLETEKSEIYNLKKKLKAFWEEVIQVRNTLSHIKEQTGKDGVPFLESINKKSGTTIKFDNKQYIKIRKNFKRHADNIEKASELILNI